MSKISKVLVIGSGPIIIGQAAEFDYAGTQACKSLREEGITTVLVNSNPATIMTDEGIADIVYIEPLTVDVVGRIIEQERPDGLLLRVDGVLPEERVPPLRDDPDDGDFCGSTAGAGFDPPFLLPPETAPRSR